MKKFCLILLALVLAASAASAERGLKSSLFNADANQPGEIVEEYSGGDTAVTEVTAEIISEEEAPQAASAVDISAEEIKSCLTSYFDYAGIAYMENEYGDITLEYPLKNGIKSLYFEITCFTNGYTAYAYPLLYADETNMAAVAEFFHRANFGMRNGNFELDMWFKPDAPVRITYHVYSDNL